MLERLVSSVAPDVERRLGRTTPDSWWDWLLSTGIDSQPDRRSVRVMRLSGHSIEHPLNRPKTLSLTPTDQARKAWRIFPAMVTRDRPRSAWLKESRGLDGSFAA